MGEAGHGEHEAETDLVPVPRGKVLVHDLAQRLMPAEEEEARLEQSQGDQVFGPAVCDGHVGFGRADSVARTPGLRRSHVVFGSCLEPHAAEGGDGIPDGRKRSGILCEHAYGNPDDLRLLELGVAGSDMAQFRDGIAGGAQEGIEGMGGD